METSTCTQSSYQMELFPMEVKCTERRINSIYLIGSLRNPEIPKLANILESEGFEVFADWFSSGPETDDWWKAYELTRNRTYKDALNGYMAEHIFSFDKHHLDRTDAAVLVAPAGKSAHMELGYTIGKGKPGFIVFLEEPERWDVMYKFATGIYFDFSELIKALEKRDDPNRSKSQSTTGKVLGGSDYAELRARPKNLRLL